MAVPGRRFQLDDLRCDLCDENRQAVGYCLQCCECLCTACENAHKRSKASKLHEILPKKDIPPEFFDENNVCGEHDNETFIYFCVKHQQPCCYKCLVSPKHKGCNLQPIDDIAKEYDTGTEYKNVKSSIKCLFKKLDDVRNDSIKYCRDAEKSIERSKIDVLNFQYDLQTQLRVVGNGMINSLEVQGDLNDKFKETTSRFCTNSHKDLTKLQNLLEFLEKQKWTHRLMLTTKLASKKIAQIDRDLKQMGMLDVQYKSKFWSFKPNIEPWEMMQRKETFGKIKVQEIGRGNMMWRLFYGLRNVLPPEEERIEHIERLREPIALVVFILVGILFGVCFHQLFVVSLYCNNNSECRNCLRLLRGYDDDGVRQLYRHYGDDPVPRCKDILRRKRREIEELFNNFINELLLGEGLLFFPGLDK